MAERPPTPNWMKPLWVRLLLVVLPGAWAIVEFVNGQGMWAVLFGAAAAWGLWSLILKYEEKGPPPGA